MDINNWYVGENMKVLCKDETCVVFQLKDESGDGIMTLYPVFQGCFVVYNDFHLESCYSGFAPDQDFFCIDHCREGRIEWQTKNHQCTYVSAGDMMVDCRQNSRKDFFFPLRHYHGISIGVMMNQTEGGILRLMDDFSVDLKELQKKFCQDNRYFIMRASSQLDRIFTEMYDIPEHVRTLYLKIKIMELFLFLENLEVPEGAEERPYFYKSQVDKVRAMVKLQTEDLSVWYTQDELSKKFQFPLTSMKHCFKGIYGCSMSEYMKTYRMNAAVEMLYDKEKSIIEIATSLGYENPAKFSAAFKAKMGMTPSAYRNTLTN